MASSRLASAAKVPVAYNIARLVDIFQGLDQKINGLAEGSISASHNATTATPSGTYSTGDFVRNATPSEQGTAGSKYVVLGWVCTDGSTSPGTFREARFLTGN